MVALYRDGDEPTRPPTSSPTVAPLWWVLTTLNRGFVRMVGKIEITGEFPPELRGRPVLVAANHIGMFDPFVLTAAFRKIGVYPQFLLTAGLLDAPVIGWFLRRSGHLRVDRGKTNVIEAFGRATEALRKAKAPLLVYPEGRVSRDPGLWPERGKTGVARMALGGDIPVVTISQWGAHEAVYWGTEVVEKPADFKPLAVSFFRALRNRPVFHVHFGDRVDLAGLSLSKPGDAMRAHKRIMRAITANLARLRPDEPDAPAFHDPTRPTDSVSPWKPERQ